MTTTIDKTNLLFDCKLFSTGKRDPKTHPICVSKCAAKFGAQHLACLSAIAAIKTPKTKTEKQPSRVPGYWGYAKGSYTDIFCNAICEKPMTMNQAAAIIDTKTGQPIGPHPKCKKRLIAEGLAVFDGHKIYMRIYPKGHPEAGKLTPAAKLHKELQAQAKSKKAA